MEKDSGSKTAFGAASLRVAHQLIDGPHKLLEDPVIVSMLGEQMQDYILGHLEKYNHPRSRALRTHIVLRSRFAEDCLERACYRGLRRYLLLGAGLDTFAYRQPAWARGLQVTEIDHPASQAAKHHLLEQANIARPENLDFASADFEKDDLMELKTTLSAADQPVFLSCLGVLVYLSEKAVQNVFGFAASFPKGSEMVFTISGKDAENSPLAQKAAEKGEPWLTHFDHGKLETHLKSMGFTACEFLTPLLARELYFNAGRITLPLIKRTSIVRAVR